MHYILSDEDKITPFVSYLCLYIYMYIQYTVSVTPRSSHRREMSICTFYIRTLIATYFYLTVGKISRVFPVSIVPALFGGAFVSKIVSKCCQCRPAKYFTMVSDNDLRRPSRSVPIFFGFSGSHSQKGLCSVPSSLTFFGSRNRSWT